MNRPTCGTCLYWDQDESEPKLGHCLRLPPVFAANDQLFAEWQGVDTNPYLGLQPETEAFDSCGEHPDFPDYIAAMKARR